MRRVWLMRQATEMDERLTGGNTHSSIIRVDDTVRRPTSPATPGVHALLRHLESVGFDGAPRVLGIDDAQREILTFIPGEVVWPDHFDFVMTDDALEMIARLIRAYHDAAATFDASGYVWSTRGQDVSGVAEVLCHNDFAPWNLIHHNCRWTFIDWDLAAPGRRSWDIAWALLSFAPLMPDRGVDVAVIENRLQIFARSYGRDYGGPDVIDVAVERCAREADLIWTLGTAGEQPYSRLLADGHHAIWKSAAEHVAACAVRWRDALSQAI